MSALQCYEANVYSQNGEDGVIAEILKRISNYTALNKWVCEFGAWNGIEISNTYNLVEKQEYNAVYIESDDAKYQELLQTCRYQPRIIPIHASVQPGDLDKILSSTNIPTDFDVLSIDIDSYDYEVWESVEQYYPKVVVIEINSSVPPGVYQFHNPEEGKFSASFTPMLELGHRKGYTFLHHMGNMIFVANQYANLFDIPSPPSSVFNNKWMH